MTGQRFPIPLNAEQEQAAKEWAADDRLWTTQETVEINLRTFARKILSAASSTRQPERDHAALLARLRVLRAYLWPADAGEPDSGRVDQEHWQLAMTVDDAIAALTSPVTGEPQETPSREWLMRRVAFYAAECERQGEIIERYQRESLPTSAPPPEATAPTGEQ